MAKVKFNRDGRMADLGKSMMPQFEHKAGDIVEVSAVCADSAVRQGIAEHVVAKAEKNPAGDDKRKADGKTLEELREKARSLEIPRAGNMGEEKLREEIAKLESE